MAMDRTELLNKVLDAYTRWYNIERTDSEPLAATATFHEDTTGYILIKKAETWKASRHEYVYFYSVPQLTQTVYEQCLQEAVDAGNQLIKPGKNHMSSNIVVIFLADAADEAALKALKRCRIRKSFHFSLYGWMEVQTAVIETGKESVTSNGAGWTTAKFLKSVLHPKVKRKFL